MADNIADASCRCVSSCSGPVADTIVASRTSPLTLIRLLSYAPKDYWESHSITHSQNLYMTGA